MDPIAKLRTRHPAFRGMNADNVTDYFGVTVPYVYLKAAEATGVPDVHPIRSEIAGEQGSIIFDHFAETKEDGDKYIMICDHLTDQCYKTRHPAIHQIVILDMVMDTSAYRLEEMTGCRVFELQLHPAVAEEKERLLVASGRTMFAKERHDFAANFKRDGWQNTLLARGFDPEQPTLWIVGSILSYMTVAGGAHLVSIIESLSAPCSQIYADVFAGHTLHMTNMADSVVTVNGPASFEMHGDSAMVFQKLTSWVVELLARRDPELNYFGTMWDPEALDRFTVHDHETGYLGPWFIARFSKPESNLP